MARIDEALVASAADSPALVRRAAGRSGTTAPRRLIRRAAWGRYAAVRTLSDVALIALVARGDRSAFDEVYLRYGAPAFRLAKRITVDPRLAEHVTQDVFLTIWRDAGRFDARRARVATWLLTITHHKAVDVVRAEQVRRTESDAQINDIADESINLPAGAWLSEQRHHVLAALATLSDVQRQVIELAYFKGHSQRQLAELLDLPLGTIKSRTHAALANLRISLESAGMA